MNEFYHECRGKVVPLRRHHLKTPFGGYVDPYGMPELSVRAEPPSHYENWLCDDCGFHLMRRVPSGPLVTREHE